MATVSKLRQSWIYFKRAGIFCCVAHCITTHVVEPVQCRGPSMMPTIEDGDLFIAEHLSRSLNTIHRKDIVACRSPIDPNMLVCKRLVAKEGDRLQSSQLSRVPRGHVWLLGDNSDRSTDSRSFGPVPHGLVSCRLVYR
uniref:Mitochondrial inner membrane protease subunit n=2 Tax=Plectus sambesii TaxID=2011161 RepID=A0A914VHA0_9BILA